jgi:hypothetical protein
VWIAANSMPLLPCRLSIIAQIPAQIKLVGTAVVTVSNLSAALILGLGLDILRLRNAAPNLDTVSELS